MINIILAGILIAFTITFIAILSIRNYKISKANDLWFDRIEDSYNNAKTIEDVENTLDILMKKCTYYGRDFKISYIYKSRFYELVHLLECKLKLLERYDIIKEK
jgi:hypothetical protein